APGRDFDTHRGRFASVVRSRPRPAPGPGALYDVHEKQVVAPGQPPKPVRRQIQAPITAPMIGPTTGIQAYPQSEVPLPGMGSSACAIRGPRSRAGLIAYPVGPPRDRPMAKTSRPIRRGARPLANSADRSAPPRDTEPS